MEETTTGAKPTKGVRFVEEEKESDDEEDIQIEDFEYQMLQEMAETLLNMTSMVRPNINENDLFILVSSGVEALQKAGIRNAQASLRKLHP